MLGKIFLSILMAVNLVGGSAYALENEKEQAAIKIAKEWIQGIDQGNYKQSWSDAAAFFKLAITQSQWDQSLKAGRGPLGKVITRELKNAQYTTTLPGAPQGEYIVIQFTTSFENKKDSIETVTPMLDQDGVWRVAGYYIQ